MTRTATALLVCALLAHAGCGGGRSDREGAEQTVRDFVTALNKRDADKFCEEVVTREFVEKQTGAKGERALADCKRQLRQTVDLKVKLVRISRLTVKGDRARVKAVLSLQGREGDQLYRLRKEDGAWRIASGTAG